jgi:hypothetical protein
MPVVSGWWLSAAMGNARTRSSVASSAWFHAGWYTRRKSRTRAVPRDAVLARAIARILCGAGCAVVFPALAGTGLPSPSTSEGMERREAHPTIRAWRGAGTLGEGCAPRGAPSRLRVSGSRQRHRPWVRASWDEALAPVPAQRAPRGGVVCPPVGSQGLPGAWLRTTPAGAASDPANMTPHDSALGGSDFVEYNPIAEFVNRCAVARLIFRNAAPRDSVKMRHGHRLDDASGCVPGPL